MLNKESHEPAAEQRGLMTLLLCYQQPNGNFLLATYRCQANTTRLELKVARASELFLLVLLLS